MEMIDHWKLLYCPFHRSILPKLTLVITKKCTNNSSNSIGTLSIFWVNGKELPLKEKIIEDFRRSPCNTHEKAGFSDNFSYQNNIPIGTVSTLML